MIIHQFISIGSYNKGTYIAEYSDRDFLIILDEKDFYRGFNFIVNELKKKYNIINIDMPSIQIKKGDNTIDLTPCIYSHAISSKYGKLDCYIIHGDDGYKKTCPSLYQKHLEEIDCKYNKELLPFIVDIKCWKYKNNISIPSFYIEILAVEYFLQGQIKTEKDFILVLENLTNNKIKDITNIDFYIKQI